MILLKILKNLLGVKFGKYRMVERARRAKVKFRYFSDNKKRTDGETQQTAKGERSMKEYWNEGAHAYRLLLELAPDSTKLFMRKLQCFNLNAAKWNQLSL